MFCRLVDVCVRIYGQLKRDREPVKVVLVTCYIEGYRVNY